MCRLSWNLGTSTSWNPLGLFRPVMGLIYLFIHAEWSRVLFPSVLPAEKANNMDIYPSSWHTGRRNWNISPSHSNLDGVFQLWLSSQALAIINKSYLKHGCRLWQTEKCRGQNKEDIMSVKCITLHFSPPTRKRHVCDWAGMGREMNIIDSDVRTVTRNSHVQLKCRL